MGLLDIFRKKKKRIFTRPKREYKIQRCKVCGRKVTHVMIRDTLLDEDPGGMENHLKVWLVKTHKNGNRKCKGSARKYRYETGYY